MTKGRDVYMGLPSLPTSRMMCRPRPRLFCFLASSLAIVTAALVLLASRTKISALPEWSEDGWLDRFSEDCRYWIPTDASTDESCPESAAKLREVQAFLNDPVFEYAEDVIERARRVEACILGLSFCPDRPLVVSSWPHLESGPGLYAQLETKAQEEWRRAVVQEAEGFSYIFVDVYNHAAALHLVRALKTSIHQVWMGERDAIECLQNPRCITAADYVQASEPELVPNVTALSEEERGVIPIWRLMVTSWLGARPSSATPPGSDLTRDWGIPTEPAGAENWGFHPLGKWHIISPYNYPQHRWVPFTNGKYCDAVSDSDIPQLKAFSELEPERTVVILGDAVDLDVEGKQQVDWDHVHTLLQEQGYNVTFVLPHSPSDEPTLPDHITGQEAELETYADLLKNADAVLGVGSPHLSTIPYIAMCRGTPSVFPHFGQHDRSQLSPWQRYDHRRFQHGEFWFDEPQPYAYKYEMGAWQQMADGLVQAFTNGKHPHMPRQFSPIALYELTEAVLNFDYKQQYDRLRSQSKGPIAINEQLRRHCWKRGWCKKDEE